MQFANCNEIENATTKIDKNNFSSCYCDDV